MPAGNTASFDLLSQRLQTDQSTTVSELTDLTFEIQTAGSINGSTLPLTNLLVSGSRFINLTLIVSLGAY